MVFSKKKIAVMTSGGDAPGMNAALRAVVRAGIHRGADVYAIYEGYSGMIAGGDQIQPMTWNSVGGILQRGGTIIGTARCAAFETRAGRKEAVRNLLIRDIDALVVIGGDGSLTGANYLQKEWVELGSELVAEGAIEPDQFEEHRHLAIAGLVGSIDNDMYGTDMTIGADTALHRITDAIDAITSTAASHQRAFVVEVMGRRCGYLAVMGAIATGAEYVLIPENPPEHEDWEARMCATLRRGVEMGRRDNIVIIAEGAQDRAGNPISSEHVRQVLADGLGEDVRITVLGHVQRGGSPTAYDRNLSTIMGVEAVDAVMTATPDDESVLIAIRNNEIVRLPLMECVERTHEINRALKECDYDRAMELRGHSFRTAFNILLTLTRALPHDPEPGQRRLRIAVMNASGPAPGMNAATRAAVRLAGDDGHIILGVRRGFRGLINNDLFEMQWMGVSGWAPRGGSDLGTSRKMPSGSDFYAIARTLEENRVDAMLVIGGSRGYQSAELLLNERDNFPAFNIPIVCVPASINNNLPYADHTIGADTALNSITDVVDKIKQSAVASNRCFVVEVMGRYCGYLALNSALATGAERVYLHEEGVRLIDLEHDIKQLIHGFTHGKRLGLMIRNENANPLYTTQFLAALFEEEGGDLFDVRISVLGHLQQGGDPSPFDRILAVRLVNRAVDYIEAWQASDDDSDAIVCCGYQNGELRITPIDVAMKSMDRDYLRPKKQWWMDLRPIARMLAMPEPS